MVKECPMEMNGLPTKVDFNIIPLGSYDFLIGMEWLDQHHFILDYYNKEFTCLDEVGNLRDSSRNSKICNYQRSFILAIEEKLQERMSSICSTHGGGT
jgi:hypothetical protein